MAPRHDSAAGQQDNAKQTHSRWAGDREKALAAGCDDYDTKPVDFPQLLAKIDALLASRS